MGAGSGVGWGQGAAAWHGHAHALVNGGGPSEQEVGLLSQEVPLGCLPFCRISILVHTHIISTSVSYYVCSFCVCAFHRIRQGGQR